MEINIDCIENVWKMEDLGKKILCVRAAVWFKTRQDWRAYLLPIADGSVDKSDIASMLEENASKYAHLPDNIRPQFKADLGWLQGNLEMTVPQFCYSSGKLDDALFQGFYHNFFDLPFRTKTVSGVRLETCPVWQPSPACLSPSKEKMASSSQTPKKSRILTQTESGHCMSLRSRVTEAETDLTNDSTTTSCYMESQAINQGIAGAQALQDLSTISTEAEQRASSRGPITTQTQDSVDGDVESIHTDIYNASTTPVPQCSSANTSPSSDAATLSKECNPILTPLNDEDIKERNRLDDDGGHWIERAVFCVRRAMPLGLTNGEIYTHVETYWPHYGKLAVNKKQAIRKALMMGKSFLNNDGAGTRYKIVQSS